MLRMPRVLSLLFCLVFAMSVQAQPSPHRARHPRRRRRGLARLGQRRTTRSAIRKDLDRALDAGQKVLARGGSAMDAVTAAIVVLEDSPWFNAGKGAVFNADGGHELDASIMEGHTRRAGAVAGVTTVQATRSCLRAR